MFPDEAGEAAGTITTLSRLGAISVEDTVAEVGVRGSRRTHQQNLVTTHSPLPVGEAPDLGRGQGQALPHIIYDHKVIAGTVHFAEFDFHLGLPGKVASPAQSCCRDSRSLTTWLQSWSTRISAGRGRLL